MLKEVLNHANVYSPRSHPWNYGAMVGRQTLNMPICIRLCSIPKTGLSVLQIEKVHFKQEWDADSCSNTCESANKEKLEEDDLDSHAGLGASRIGMGRKCTHTPVAPSKAVMPR